MQGQADDLSRHLSVESDTVDPLLTKLSADFEVKGSLSKYNILNVIRTCQEYA